MPTVLVADADASILRLLTLILKDAGYAVTVTASVTKACDLLRTQPFDVVIADSLTLHPGVALTKPGPIRHAAGRTPVLLFTADRVAHTDAVAAGFQDVIPKPFELDTMLAQVQEALTKPAPAMNHEDDVPALFQQGMQRQASLMRALTRDLGQPLAQVRGTLALLQQAFVRGDIPSNTELTQTLDGLTACTDHVAATMTELLDLTLSEAEERPTLVVHPVDLVALVREAVWVQQATASQQLVFQPPADVLHMDADRDRLSRVVALLLAHARAYSPETSEIRLALSRQEDEGRPWAVLTVADHGVGIPATDLPHIFERFSRGANVAATTTGDSIGLSIAQHTVEQHGGTLQVDSTQGQGATVTVWLPLD